MAKAAGCSTGIDLPMQNPSELWARKCCRKEARSSWKNNSRDSCVPVLETSTFSFSEKEDERHCAIRDALRLCHRSIRERRRRCFLNAEFIRKLDEVRSLRYSRLMRGLFDVCEWLPCLVLPHVEGSPSPWQTLSGESRNGFPDQKVPRSDGWAAAYGALSPNHAFARQSPTANGLWLYFYNKAVFIFTACVLFHVRLFVHHFQGLLFVRFGWRSRAT